MALEELPKEQQQQVMDLLAHGIPLDRYPYFDHSLRSLLKPISMTRQPAHAAQASAHAAVATASFELTVPHGLCNGTDNLHGGATALIFDVCTSAAIIAATLAIFDADGDGDADAGSGSGSGVQGSSASKTAAAARIDTLSRWTTGHVSRTLNCTYLRPVPLGTKIGIECEVVHIGKSLCLTTGLIRRLDTGAVCSRCEHNKAAVVPEPSRL